MDLNAIKNKLQNMQQKPKGKKIDYDKIFEKGFTDPLKVILDTIGWQTEQTTTLDSFFL